MEDKYEKQMLGEEEKIQQKEKLDSSKNSQETVIPPMGLEVLRRELVRDKVAMFSLAVVIIVALTAIIAPFFLDVDSAMTVDIFSRFAEPGEKGYILGADEGGRDVLTMLIVGTRNSLMIGVGVTILTSSFGIALGIMAGYYGGTFEDIIMRIVDFLMVIPYLMIIIAILTLIAPITALKLTIVISALGWMGITRLFRTASLSESSKDYVAASKTMGTHDLKIMYTEVMPNLSSLIITYLTLSFAGNIGVETGLSFLGFGLPYDIPSLGTLIGFASNPDVIQNKWWVWLPAVILILILMLSISYIGQALQRAADSRQRIG